jgi:hypothetical protein
MFSLLIGIVIAVSYVDTFRERFAQNSEGRTIWIADAHRDGKRFVVRADEKLTAFLGLEAAIAATANVEETTWQTPEPWASEGLAKANLFHYLFRI